jgi:hypothetical protein
MGMTDEHFADDDAPLTRTQAAAAADYHAPPAVVPRDAMWAGIVARRTRGESGAPASQHVDVARPVPAAASAPAVSVTRTTRAALPRASRWFAGAAIAAALIIAVSRWRTAPVPPVTVATANDSASTAAWQVASSEHFGQAESMLTTLATSPASPSDRQLTAWSRDLLESTRLLMDSPAGRDPKRRVLLQELELVLVQLVESGPAMRTEDRSVMDELLSRSAVLLTRIRTTVPAGMPASHN